MSPGPPAPDALGDGIPSFDPGDGSAADRLWLADWRRRVAALYAEVRTLAATDPMAAHTHWRSVREVLFRTHPQSPIPAGERAVFQPRHFDYDPNLRFDSLVEPTPGPMGRATVRLRHSDDDILSFSLVGNVTLPFLNGARRLSVFWMAGYAGGLFIPFCDATNGGETYAAGRYLIDAAKGHDLGGDSATGRLILDFNFATQPSCAFDPRWACPLAPPENRLDLPIHAGERLA